MFTGLSGSGKSSLAFDTIFAEGQRRYVESLSAYARQFLGQMDKPDVDFIEGLSPAVSIDQKSTNRNPRSTVGTITEVYDYLRLLYARAGMPHCPVCGQVIERQTPQQIVDQVLAMAGGQPVPGARPGGAHPQGRVRRPVLRRCRPRATRGCWSTARCTRSTDPPKLKKQEKHDIAVVVDRLAVKDIAKQRLTDSVETALRLADGLVVLDFVDLARATTRTASAASPSGWPARTATRSALDDLEPRTFSFNSPYGACPECTRHRDQEGGRPGAGGARRRGQPGRRARSRRGRAGRPRSTSAGCWRALAETGRVPDGHPVAQAAGRGAEGGAARHRRAGARPLPQPVRPRALLLRRPTRA